MLHKQCNYELLLLTVGYWCYKYNKHCNYYCSCTAAATSSSYATCSIATSATTTASTAVKTTTIVSCAMTASSTANTASATAAALLQLPARPANCIVMKDSPNVSVRVSSCSSVAQRQTLHQDLATGSQLVRRTNVMSLQVFTWFVDKSIIPLNATYMASLNTSVLLCVCTGGRDKRGGPILTFPARSNHDRIKQEDLRRLVTYLSTVPRYTHTHAHTHTHIGSSQNCACRMIDV